MEGESVVLKWRLLVTLRIKGNVPGEFYHFTFLSPPQTQRWPAKGLNRFGPAFSNEHGFSFIAQTFTILFAAYPPADWQRLPLYRRDIFWLFFFVWRLRRCVLEGGYMTDTVSLYARNNHGSIVQMRCFCLQALVMKIDEKEQTSWLYVILNQQDTWQALLIFLSLLSRFILNFLASSIFPFYI